MTIGSVTSLNPMYTTKAFITRTWLAKGPNLRRGIIFSDFSQTNYLNIYRTDLHEICRIGRTLSVDERSEVIFCRFLKGRCRGNQFCGQRRAAGLLLLTVVRAPRRTPPAAAADIDQQLSWYAAPALSNKRGRPTDDAPHRLVFYSSGGSTAE